MSLLKHCSYFYFIPLIILLISCNQSKSIYLSNTTNTAITLHIDSNLNIEKETMLLEFKNALNGKRIEPGSISIYFGAGKWRAAEEESLKQLLQNTFIKKDGSDKSFKLPNTLKIGHGIFIPELIIKIGLPK